VTRQVFEFGLAAGTELTCFSNCQAAYEAISKDPSVLNMPFVIAKREAAPSLRLFLALCLAGRPRRSVLQASAWHRPLLTRR